MRVALDMAHLAFGMGGTARCAIELRDALMQRSDVEVVSVMPASQPGKVASRYVTALRYDLSWYPAGGRRAARDAGADAYHVPVPRGPVTKGLPPTVVTVHDLVVLRHPEVVRPWNRRYSRLILPRLAHTADLFVVPSIDTASDVEQFLRVPPSRIRVVRNGVSCQFFGDPARPAPVTEPYVLFVGSSGPRKNLNRLIDAIALLRKRGYRERLVVAGSDGWVGSRPVVAEGVHVVGRVNDEELHALYAGARCLVLPSLHEGFGLPALEAMACGTPVVAARSGALPEVCGEAAVMVDAYDATSIADGIVAALDDAESLRTAGRARARLFTWSAAAEQAVAAYRTVV